jgi:hypothetical protein
MTPEFAECHRCAKWHDTILLSLPHPQRWCIPCIEAEMMRGLAQQLTEPLGQIACSSCGGTQTRVQCPGCDGNGFVDHDCGEDPCMCFVPEDNIACDICLGQGVVMGCPKCMHYWDR